MVTYAGVYSEDDLTAKMACCDRILHSLFPVLTQRMVPEGRYIHI